MKFSREGQERQINYWENKPRVSVTGRQVRYTYLKYDKLLSAILK